MSYTARKNEDEFSNQPFSKEEEDRIGELLQQGD